MTQTMKLVSFSHSVSFRFINCFFIYLYDYCFEFIIVCRCYEKITVLQLWRKRNSWYAWLSVLFSPSDTLAAENRPPEEKSSVPSRLSSSRDNKLMAQMRMEQSMTQRCGPEEDGFLYALGATVSCYLQTVGGCSTCKFVLCQPAPATSFILERKYTSESRLLFPSADLVILHECRWKYRAELHINSTSSTRCNIQNCRPFSFLFP